MTERNNNRNQDRILYAMFCLSRATLRIDLAALADGTSLTRLQAEQALVALGEAGLVDRGRLRLTMLGLMKATALTGDLGGTAPMAQKLGRNYAPVQAAPLAAGAVAPGRLASGSDVSVSELAAPEAESRLYC